MSVISNRMDRTVAQYSELLWAYQKVTDLRHNSLRYLTVLSKIGKNSSESHETLTKRRIIC